MIGKDTVQHVINDLIDQITRDNWTLNNITDPSPDVEFYLDRIKSFTAEVKMLQDKLWGR